MGYESKIIVARKCSIECKDAEPYVFSIELARMNLAVAGGIERIFTEPLTWEIHGDGFEVNSNREFDMTEDCYGDICKYTDIQTVIDWLENAEATEHYRRFTPALAMLKAYAAETWDDPLIVIHYGY